MENPEEQEVRVHCDGVVLSIQKDDSGGWQCEEIIQRYPEATAVEMEGRGKMSLLFVREMLLCTCSNLKVFSVVTI